MTILVSVIANPHEPVHAANEGAYNWSRDHCDGDTMWPKTLTIFANCIILYFEEDESFLIPLHRVQEVQWEEGDNVYYK